MTHRQRHGSCNLVRSFRAASGRRRIGTGNQSPILGSGSQRQGQLGLQNAWSPKGNHHQGFPNGYGTLREERESSSSPVWCIPRQAKSRTICKFDVNFDSVRSGIFRDSNCNQRKMAYFSCVVKKSAAFIACFLATLVLGFADLPQLSPRCCAVAAPCCCNDPASATSCFCSDHTDSDFPGRAVLSGLPSLGAPPVVEVQTGEIAPLEDLLPRWHPTLPWHTPPEEKRARSSVWIL